MEGAARPREPIGEQKFLCSVSILAVSIKVSFDIALRSLDIFFISTRGRMVFPPFLPSDVNKFVHTIIFLS